MAMRLIEQFSMFSNPILPGFNPDPSIARCGSDYFLATSSFEYFPGVPIYHSTDLVNWRLLGHALTRKSQLELRTVESGGGIWAPTLRWRAHAGNEMGRFYLATCKFDRYRPQDDERVFPRGFYVYTDNIWDETAWSDPVYFDNPGFDQDLFWDDASNKVYLSTSMRLTERPENSTKKDFAIHISEIDLETGSSLTPPKVIRESPVGLAEGSHIVKRGDFYYLFTAEGGTEAGHQEWVFRNREGPLGPWEPGPRNPLWYNGPGEEVQRTGHCDVFTDMDGKWWAVLLGVRPQIHKDKYLAIPLGRETFLVTVDWVDDWPIFNHGKNISLLTKGRGVMAQKEADNVWKADLASQHLEVGWYAKHTPLKPFYSSQSRPGCLRIFGNCNNLSSPDSPAMLLRKQTGFRQRFCTSMRIPVSRTIAEAGVVVWWNSTSYASIALERTTGELVNVILTEPKWRGAISEHVPTLRQAPSTLQLPVDASRSRLSSYYERLAVTSDSYDFEIETTELDYLLVVSSGDQILMSFNIPSCALTVDPKVGAAFGGMMLGVFAFGKNQPCLDPVDFYNIEMGDTESVPRRWYHV